MGHDEVREALETAAAEPFGIERLMAGDTPDAQAVSAHLAGCEACTEELVRVRRTALLVRDAVRSTAPPELRERTLALVREVGRSVPEPAPPGVVHGAGTAAGGTRTGGAGTGRRLGWIAAAAAVLVLAVAGTAMLVTSRVDDRLSAQQAATEGLARVATAALALGTETDATRVRLAEGAGAAQPVNGTLVFSPSSAELVVVADGLDEPAADREYRCWVEIDGERSGVGKMYFGGGLAYWAGRADQVAGLPDGSRFGVSLVDLASETVVGEPVLEGRVGG